MYLYGPILCCIQHHFPHPWMLSTPDLWSEGVDGGWSKGAAAELAPCTFAACDHSQLAVTSCREHVLKVSELWDKFKLYVSNLNLCIFSSINSTSCPKASGVPELKVRAQGSLNATAFLMHSALACSHHRRLHCCIHRSSIVCCLVHRGSTDDLLLLQIPSGVVRQTRDLYLSRNTLYLLSPRLCFFIVLKRDLFVYLDDSLTS